MVQVVPHFNCYMPQYPMIIKLLPSLIQQENFLLRLVLPVPSPVIIYGSLINCIQSETHTQNIKAFN